MINNGKRKKFSREKHSLPFSIAAFPFENERESSTDGHGRGGLLTAAAAAADVAAAAAARAVPQAGDLGHRGLGHQPRMRELDLPVVALERVADQTELLKENKKVYKWNVDLAEPFSC